MPDSAAQPGNRPDVPGINQAITDAAPRLDEIVGYTEASIEHRVSIWTIRRAVKRGELRAYPLPGKRNGLHRDAVRRWVEQRGK